MHVDQESLASPLDRTLRYFRQNRHTLVKVLINDKIAEVRTSPKMEGKLTNVRHEHYDSESKLLECATTRLMRVGPSEPVCRDRFQTTSSGADQKSGS